MCQKENIDKKAKQPQFFNKNEYNFDILFKFFLSMDNSLWEFVYASPKVQSVPCSWVSITWYDISI